MLTAALLGRSCIPTWRLAQARAASQNKGNTRTVWSSEAVATCLSSGLRARSWMPEACPVRVRTHVPAHCPPQEGRLAGSMIHHHGELAGAGSGAGCFKAMQVHMGAECGPAADSIIG